MNKVISTYNKERVSMFQDISDFLKQNIDKYIRIAHVGSTSIPGMDAKPTIDIDIVLSNKEKLVIVIAGMGLDTDVQ